MLKKLSAIIIAVLLAASMAACQKPETLLEIETTESTGTATLDEATPDEAATIEAATEPTTVASTTVAPTTKAVSTVNGSTDSASTNDNTTNGTKKTDSNYTYNEIVSDITYSTVGSMNAKDIFTTRDLTQNADLTDATYFTVTSGSNINITSAGVYVLSGNASNVTVTINAGELHCMGQCVYVKSITINSFPRTLSGGFYIDGAKPILPSSSSSNGKSSSSSKLVKPSF